MKNKILVEEDKIAQRVKELAAEISKDYQGREIDFICLINGASFFCTDLVRRISVPSRIHFLGFTSYSSANVTGEISIGLDVKEPLYGKNLLIIEGIVVSGRTPKFVYEYLKLRKPASIEFCAVGTKPDSLAVDLDIKYSAFEFQSDLMVGGYGIGKGTEKSLSYLVEL